MKVKEEDLWKGIEIVELNPRTGFRRYYWGSVHRVETDPASAGLVLKTTDGNSWIETLIPVEGFADLGGMNISRERLMALKTVLPGGAVELVQDTSTKNLEFHRHQLHIRMPYETSDAPFPEANVSGSATTWRFSSDRLAMALEFASPHMLKAGNAIQTCVTLHSDGTLIGGSPQNMALVEGVRPKVPADSPVTHMSLTYPQVQLTRRFLPHLKPTAEVTFTESPRRRITFSAPESRSRLILDGTEAQFGLRPEQLRGNWTERSLVDRKYLLVTLKAFSALSVAEADPPVQLTFRGENGTASVTVSISDKDGTPRCSDEWVIFRECPAGGTATETVLKFRATQLLQALSGMDTVSLEMTYDGRSLRIKNEFKGYGESNADGEGEQQGAMFSGSVFLPYRQNRTAPDEKTGSGDEKSRHFLKIQCTESLEGRSARIAEEEVTTPKQ